MLDERDEWSNMKRTKLQFIQFTQFYKTLLENLEGIKNSWKWNGPVQVKGQLGKLILNCWGFFCVQKFWNNAKMKFCHMVQRWSDRIWKSRLTAQRNLQRKTLWRAYWPLGCCALLSLSSAKPKESSKELSSCWLWPYTRCLIQTESRGSAYRLITSKLFIDMPLIGFIFLRNKRQKGKTPWKKQKKTLHSEKIHT